MCRLRTFSFFSSQRLIFRALKTPVSVCIRSITVTQIDEKKKKNYIEKFQQSPCALIYTRKTRKLKLNGTQDYILFYLSV